MAKSRNQMLFIRLQNCGGIYLMVTALVVSVLVILCLLVVGLAYQSSTKQRMQNVANLSAIAALQEFIETKPPSSVPPENQYSSRADSALTRANYIVSANKYPGLRHPLDPIQFATAGGGSSSSTLELGNWYIEPL